MFFNNTSDDIKNDPGAIIFFAFVFLGLMILFLGELHTYENDRYIKEVALTMLHEKCILKEYRVHYKIPQHPRFKTLTTTSDVPQEADYTFACIDGRSGFVINDKISFTK